MGSDLLCVLPLSSLEKGADEAQIWSSWHRRWEGRTFWHWGGSSVPSSALGRRLRYGSACPLFQHVLKLTYVAQTVFPENSVMLPIMGALFSVPCFYVVVTRVRLYPVLCDLEN